MNACEGCHDVHSLLFCVLNFDHILHLQRRLGFISLIVKFGVSCGIGNLTVLERWGFLIATWIYFICQLFVHCLSIVCSLVVELFFTFCQDVVYVLARVCSLCVKFCLLFVNCLFAFVFVLTCCSITVNLLFKKKVVQFLSTICSLFVNLLFGHDFGHGYGHGHGHGHNHGNGHGHGHSHGYGHGRGETFDFL